MRKLLLIIVAVLTVSAVSAQQWSAGLRAGAGVQAVGQLTFGNKNYIEARFGASWINPVVTVAYESDNKLSVNSSRIMADFTILHNWRVVEMDWTPEAGRWFFDAGVGVNVGGKAHYAYVGLAGMARLRITFNDAPISLSVDWTPSFGPGILYVGEYNDVVFNELGLAGLGITCTYNF